MHAHNFTEPLGAVLAELQLSSCQESCLSRLDCTALMNDYEQTGQIPAPFMVYSCSYSLRQFIYHIQRRCRRRRRRERPDGPSQCAPWPPAGRQESGVSRVAFNAEGRPRLLVPPVSRLRSLVSLHILFRVGKEQPVFPHLHRALVAGRRSGRFPIHISSLGLIGRYGPPGRQAGPVARCQTGNDWRRWESNREIR